ncbi:MAG: pilus assembly protein CpaE, partial [Corynebacterium matruchotii]
MTTTPTILVSVTDPVLHPEAINIAAATGMDIIDTSDPRDIVRHAPKAAAILVDATTATHAGGIHPRGHLFLLHPEPGPVDWTLAVRIGAADAVILPAQSNKLLATLAATTAAPDSPSPAAAASVIAVTGAVGGAGTSTLAVALALQLHEIVPTVLVDADPVSPGMDLLLGCETTGGIRWADLSFRSGSIAAADLIAALPETESGLPV